MRSYIVSQKLDRILVILGLSIYRPYRSRYWWFSFFFVVMDKPVLWITG